jgi:DNA (cytosine-5)-methyltransferase 1
MFGLGLDGRILKRHRLFESNVGLTALPDACHGKPAVGVYGTGGAWTRTAPGGGGVKASGADAARAMGIDWTDYQPVLAQAIPPAYTEFIGAQLLERIEAAA